MCINFCVMDLLSMQCNGEGEWFSRYTKHGPGVPLPKSSAPWTNASPSCTMYLIPKCPKGLFSTIFWDFEVMHRLSLNGLYICIDASYLLIVHNFVERRNIFKDQKVKVSNQSIKAKKKNYWAFRGSFSLYISFSSQNYQRQIKLDEISWFYVLGFMFKLQRCCRGL
jgi:hypothetical protein